MKKIKNAIAYLEAHKYAPELNRIYFKNWSSYPAPQCNTISDFIDSLKSKVTKTGKIYQLWTANGSPLARGFATYSEIIEHKKNRPSHRIQLLYII